MNSFFFSMWRNILLGYPKLSVIATSRKIIPTKGDPPSPPPPPQETEDFLHAHKVNEILSLTTFLSLFFFFFGFCTINALSGSFNLLGSQKWWQICGKSNTQYSPGWSAQIKIMAGYSILIGLVGRNYFDVWYSYMFKVVLKSIHKQLLSLFLNSNEF